MANIHRASTPEELTAVYRLRYSVNVDEMKRHEPWADHANRLLSDDLDCEHALVLTAWTHGELVATVRGSYLRGGCVGEYPDYYGLRDLSPQAQNGTSITTRFMVHRDYRRSPVTIILFRELYRQALRDGIMTDYLDCDPAHVGLFAAFGYTIHKDVFDHPLYGPGVVMRLELTDRAHLARIRSPFLKVPWVAPPADAAACS